MHNRYYHRRQSGVIRAPYSRVRPTLRAPFVVCLAVTLSALSSAQATAAARDARRPLLPGIQPGGTIVLPNQWSLRPAGRQIELGDFPVNMALHPSGRWLAILHAGYG